MKVGAKDDLFEGLAYWNTTKLESKWGERTLCFRGIMDLELFLWSK
jgi:hypothetical protein